MNTLIKFRILFTLIFIVSITCYSMEQESATDTLFKAVINSDVQTLETYKDFINRSHCAIRDSYSRTLLQTAILEGKTEIINWLFDNLSTQALDLGNQSVSNETALTFAIQFGKWEVVDRILTLAPDMACKKGTHASRAKVSVPPLGRAIETLTMVSTKDAQENIFKILTRILNQTPPSLDDIRYTLNKLNSLKRPQEIILFKRALSLLLEHTDRKKLPQDLAEECSAKVPIIPEGPEKQLQILLRAVEKNDLSIVRLYKEYIRKNYKGITERFEKSFLAYVIEKQRDDTIPLWLLDNLNAEDLELHNDALVIIAAIGTHRLRLLKKIIEVINQSPVTSSPTALNASLSTYLIYLLEKGQERDTFDVRRIITLLTQGGAQLPESQLYNLLQKALNKTLIQKFLCSVLSILFACLLQVPIDPFIDTVARTQGDHVTVMEALLHERSLTPGWTNTSAQTPLHTAVIAGNYGCVKLLLERTEIDQSAPDPAGQTALQIAFGRDRREIAQLIIDATQHTFTIPAITIHQSNRTQQQIPTDDIFGDLPTIPGLVDYPD